MRFLERDRQTIVYVIGSLAIAGAEKQLVLLAEQMHSRGWKVAVFALNAKGALAEHLRSQKIPVLDGGYSEFNSKIQRQICLCRAVLRLLVHLVRRRPTIVHGFLPLTNFLAAFLGRLSGAPLIVTSKRGLGTHQDRHPYLKWLDKVANQLSDVVTANSNAVARDTEARDGCSPAKLKVIPNGLDFSSITMCEARLAMREALGLSDDEIGIVTIANLIPYKGHAELFDAFGHVLSSTPNVKLYVVGEDRGIQPQLAKQASQQGILDRILFLGLRRDVPRILTAMDVGVMASHEEGFSNAVLEKLAAGLPVVVTDVGGNAEALAGMPNCYLVKPRDPIDLSLGLLSAIRSLPEPDHARQMRAQRTRKCYSVEAMANAYENIYRVVICSKNCKTSF